MVTTATRWAFAAQIALVAVMGCDSEAEPAPKAEPDTPANADGAEKALASPAPAPTPAPTTADAASLDLVAETLEIERVTAGVFRVPRDAVYEVLFAFGDGAWTGTPVAEGIVVHTSGAPRLGARLEVRDGDILTGVGDLAVTSTTTARQIYTAFSTHHPALTTWLRDGKPRRVLYRLDQTRPARARKGGTRTDDILRVAVALEPKPTIERAVLAAFRAAGPDADTKALLEALKLPDEPIDVALDGTSVVPDDLARVLGEHADAKQLTLSVNGEERNLEVVASTIDATDLAEHLGARGRPDRSRIRGLFGDGPSDPEVDLVPSGPPTALPLDGAEATTGVTITGDGKLEVSKKTLRDWLDNPAEVAKAARIIPSQRDGVVEGYKLYGIRRASIANSLGLRNGDMITSVDGKDLTSVESALDLYANLRSARKIDVEIVRKGLPFTLEITIK